MTPDGLTPADVIAAFGLEPLPVEGGLYRRWYVGPDVLRADGLPDRYETDKPSSTAIVVMITDDRESFSAIHQLRTDEVWHFYIGDPLELVILEAGGVSRRVMLGHDLLAGQVPFALAPRGSWFGADLAEGGRFAVFGCTIAPGFTPDDFRGGVLDDLLAGWPQEADAIRRLHRSDEPLVMPGAPDKDELPRS